MRSQLRYPDHVRVQLVVSGNKYTGAAAAAEHAGRALHAVGVQARLIFVAGENLEHRLQGFPWAEPSLRKERRPADLRFNLAVVRSAAADADVVICHLPHDHYLCVLAGVHRVTPLVRSFRNPRHLRRDPLHRRLNGLLAGAVAANPTLAIDLGRCLPHMTPRQWLAFPLEERFRPGADGHTWRAALGIPPTAPVIGMVGKVAPGRGFDVLLRAAAELGAEVHVLAVGHGEARPSLEALADRLGLGDRVHWAGYQERALPELYSAMDVVLFTAAGSDHGHRMISEAQGCGRPVVAADLPGVAALIQDGISGRIVSPTPAALAEAAGLLLRNPELARQMGQASSKVTEMRRFTATGRRLSDFLSEVIRRATSGEE